MIEIILPQREDDDMGALHTFERRRVTRAGVDRATVPGADHPFNAERVQALGQSLPHFPIANGRLVAVRKGDENFNPVRAALFTHKRFFPYSQNFMSIVRLWP